MRRPLLRAGRLADGWRAGASCRGLDTNLFFPPGTVGTSGAALNEIRRICESCPVQQACLQWAIAAGVTDGIWGGLTPIERRSYDIKQRRRGNDYRAIGIREGG